MCRFVFLVSMKRAFTQIFYSKHCNFSFWIYSIYKMCTWRQRLFNVNDTLHRINAMQFTFNGPLAIHIYYMRDYIWENFCSVQVFQCLDFRIVFFYIHVVVEVTTSQQASKLCNFTLVRVIDANIDWTRAILAKAMLCWVLILNSKQFCRIFACVCVIHLFFRCFLNLQKWKSKVRKSKTCLTKRNK